MWDVADASIGAADEAPWKVSWCASTDLALVVPAVPRRPGDWGRGRSTFVSAALAGTCALAGLAACAGADPGRGVPSPTGTTAAATPHGTASSSTDEAQPYCQDRSPCIPTSLRPRRGDGTTAHLLGAVEAHFEDTGEVLDPAGQLALDSHVPIGRTARAFDAARAAGCRLSLDDAYAPLR